MVYRQRQIQQILLGCKNWNAANLETYSQQSLSGLHGLGVGRPWCARWQVLRAHELVDANAWLMVSKPNLGF